MPMTHLVIIGDGPLRNELEGEAAQLLSGRYTFLGAQSPAIVHAWLQQAMVFCVPSVTAANGDSEGLGMVFCEAQAMGVPVVSFASGGIPEAVIHGVTGVLLPEKDRIGLAQAICRLLKNRDRWAEMSKQGQRRIRQNFNLSLQTAILENKYEEVIAASQMNEFFHNR